MKPKVSIIVPCFNEEEAIPIFYEAITDVMKNLENPYQVLFINDGSSDRTALEIMELSERDPHIDYINFSRNFGKEAAMLAGFQNADGDYVTIMDVDLQDPPELLPEMIEILDSGEYDSVATRRTDRSGEPPVRSFFSRKFYDLINRISDTDIKSGARDYRLMKRMVVDAICSMPEKNRFSKGIFGWIGYRTCWIDFENTPRSAGETKWSFWKLFKYAIDGIEDFSSMPLYISSWFGIAMTAVSVILLIFLVIRKIFFGDPVAGWASTICVIVFIGGIQLFCLGVMGQYLAKIYTESKQRPSYLVASTSLKEDRKQKRA